MKYNPAKRINPIYLAIAIIIVASLGVYFNTLWNDFVYDDGEQVLENPFIKDIRYIPQIFVTDVWAFKVSGEVSNYYRPIMHIIYMIDYHIFGFKAWGYHLTNIIFHASISVLVFFFALKLFNLRPIISENTEAGNKEAVHSTHNILLATVSGILFAVHPIHTEVVAWVSGIPELSFTFFYLLSFYLYASSNNGGKGRYILSVVFFFISALCKETALTLPLLIVVYDYCFINYTIPTRINSGSSTLAMQVRTGIMGLLEFKRYIPYCFAAGIYFIIRIHSIGSIAPMKKHAELSNYEYLINIFPLFTQYLEKLIFPINMNAFYVLHPISSIFEWKGIITITITLVFLFALIIFRKASKTALLSLMWIGLPLLPVLYIPALGENTFADRYLYLSSVGFVILLSIGIGKIYEKRLFGKASLYAITAILVAAATLYSIGTIKRNYIWKNDFALWSDTVPKSPEAYIPHNFLGVSYFKLGRYQEAIEEYQASIRLQPFSSDAYNNLGIVYDRLDRLDEAISVYQKIIKLRPDRVDAYNNLGVAYEKLGYIEEAIEVYKRAIILKPEDAVTYRNLGISYAKLGRIEDSIDEFQKAIRLRPDKADVYNNLGISYAKLGRREEAIAAYQKATRVDPDNADAYNNLGISYSKLGRTEEAIREFQKAVRLETGNAGNHFNLGIMYEKKGLKEEAIKEFKEALKIKPDFTDTHKAIERLEGWP